VLRHPHHEVLWIEAGHEPAGVDLDWILALGDAICVGLNRDQGTRAGHRGGFQQAAAPAVAHHTDRVARAHLDAVGRERKASAGGQARHHVVAPVCARGEDCGHVELVSGQLEDARWHQVRRSALSARTEWMGRPKARRCRRLLRGLPSSIRRGRSRMPISRASRPPPARQTDPTQGAWSGAQTRQGPSG
jgi:hypothetical protein